MAYFLWMRGTGRSSVIYWKITIESSRSFCAQRPHWKNLAGCKGDVYGEISQQIPVLFSSFWTYISGVIIIFFYRSMERAGMLNYRDETDIYCLHTVFFPLIKKSVEIHRKSWNLHKHRMLRYKSPNSVFNWL